MSHKAFVEAESMRMYEHRNYVLGRIDQRHFDALNKDNHVSQLNGYCLDAIDEIPCGAMKGSTRRSLTHQRSMPRGWTLAERERCDAIAMRLIREVLAEVEDT